MRRAHLIFIAVIALVAISAIGGGFHWNCARVFGS
jgi:hypothetical protein